MKKILTATVFILLTGFIVSCNSVKTSENGSTTTAATFKSGKYAGKTPSGNVVITFKPDQTFTLQETIPGSTDPMSSTGTWKYDEGSKKIILAYKDIADRVTTFSIVNSKTIQMNSGSAWTTQTSGSEYNLILQ
ncbi:MULTISPECIES: copper resistance protein NlpE N-terminal domain-containing protein [Chryseobacterium]|uniref:copper resistance protein NlpE N-terminal domain-containing protein n=1 Tax=Chryseobacterium TaxID=59732 RepID=UPI001297D6D9|nr:MULTISPECIES: copper resistance protein NlpE N-terminal domain-containing protein [Chryseobacterium]MDR6919684.1 hypothetical protein [Chryseobacterium sp. 2987]